MASSASGNVVPIGEHPRARTSLTAQESADALSACRKMALERMAQALSGMLDRVEDDLFTLAEQTRDREEQNTYLDARSKAREKRAAIEGTFRQHFLEFFDRKVRGAPAPVHARATGELALMEPEALEESIALREMARKLGAACEDELFALSQRIAFLLQRPELEDEGNPVSPLTIFAALKDACDQIESSFKVRMALLRQLERHAEGALQAVYHDMNAQLVERRVLPEMRLGMRKSGNAPRRVADAPAGAPASAAPELFGMLAQLLGTGAGAAASAGAPGAPLAAAAPSSVEATMNAQAGFLAELTRLHRESGPAPGCADASADQALVNVVKTFKGGPLAASLGGVDAVTIDIVAMLFDYIFEDRHIPATIKAQLARLQIPTLKVALLDKGFFSSRAHPARRLIDLLAECSIGVDEANAQEGGVLPLVEGVVGRVLAEFGTDIDLFAREVMRVEVFMEERRAAESALIERSARMLEQREREEAAQLAALEEIERRIELRVWVAPTVRTMLVGPWSKALGAVYAAEGAESAAAKELISTADDLLWSVEPKAAPEDRRRLVGMLPRMLTRLGAGLERAGLPTAQRDEFFGALVDSHAAAVKAGLRGIAAMPDAAPVPAEEETGIARAIVPAGDVQIEEVRLRAPRKRGPQRNVFTRTGIWTNLQRGTWVEFVAASGARTRSRLTWVSPNKAVYLFTNPLSSAVALSISPEALAEQMRLGEARMLDDAPLVDRAVDSMVATLRQAESVR